MLHLKRARERPLPRLSAPKSFDEVFGGRGLLVLPFGDGLVEWEEALEAEHSLPAILDVADQLLHLRLGRIQTQSAQNVADL